jgi:hypothetical protein
MEKSTNLIKSPITVGIIGLIIGTLFGLVVLGWFVWPVEWTDATPAQMSADWQEVYLRLVITDFGVNQNVAQSQVYYEALGATADEALAQVTQNPETLSPELIASFTTQVAGTAPAPEEAAESGFNWLSVLLPLLCVLLLVLAGVAVYLLLLRPRYKPSGSTEPTPAQQAAEARRQTAVTDYTAQGTEAPIVQFMASYKLGDDLFDDSFSIDTQNGEFLGECGVGISEAIGVGDPKKVTAFEVWLFDKNDIQTVTKVLMSTHAFNDASIRQRLATKGEAVQAVPGSEFVLETQTLTMAARVVDMGYGEGAMPEESYFDHLLLELAIWQK